jgi:3-methylcrotonyl-CoA carboxylase alpha subunit
MKKFSKILIANRGEIAVRIIKTLDKLGICSIVVYTRDEKDCLAVKMAGEAYLLTGNTIRETYLNIRQIVEIAIMAKADAIHPGYGFLSENFGFAKACEVAGIAFIGPSADSIQLMGDKIRARECAKLNGIPVLKSLYGSPDALALNTGFQLNFPVLVKPSGGGGGKGMKIARDLDSLKDAIHSARREAANYFGNPEIYLEEYIEDPKHIEVQVFGDGRGNVIHLFERECSLQRRFQKIIEEAPSPSLNDQERKRLYSYALNLSSAVNYRNAGTVEFLVDKEKNFYFLEMNTRIQVEHPVTECITGIDIVEEQVWIAQHGSLRLQQKDIKLKGHAIELRIYAEDPLSDFLPSAGKILQYQEPSDKDLRIDKGFDLPSSISSNYDPLVAKIIALGENRKSVIEKLKNSLPQYKILGISTNLQYLNLVIHQAEFENAGYTTNFTREKSEFLADALKELRSYIPWEVAAAIWVLALTSTSNSKLDSEPWERDNNWRSVPYFNFQLLTKEYFFLADIHKNSISIRNLSTEKSITVEHRKNSTRLKMDEIAYQCLWARANTGEILVDINGSVFELYPAYLLKIKNTKSDSDLASIEENEIIRSPMPGKIVNLKVLERKAVKKGEILMILESMKMENNICASRNGIVQNFFVKNGEQVDKDAPLLLLGPS